MKDLYIPAGVEEIGKDAFYGCSLLSITVDPKNEVYESPDNCNAIIEKATHKLLQASEGTLTIPATVTSIGQSAFARVTLNKIEIPQSVVNWDDAALNYINTTTIKVSYPEPLDFSTYDSSPIGYILGTPRLIVPNGTRNLYASAKYWDEFTKNGKKDKAKDKKNRK